MNHDDKQQSLKARLGLFDSTTIVAGSMIGSGIFIVAADIARNVASPSGLLLVWIISGLMTIAGALAYGELAAMMPQAGGQYVYLREAYGGLCAFLFGWTLFLVIQTGTIAAVCVAFARYAGVLVPSVGSGPLFGHGHLGLSTEQIGAILTIAALTWINSRGIDTGVIVQNLFTSAKVLSLLLIVFVTLLLKPNPSAMQANFGSWHAFVGGQNLSLAYVAAFGAAMVGGLFSADAWATVTFTASEVRRPGRDLPLSLAIGTGVVILLYILTNVGYLAQLPLNGSPGADNVIARGIAGAQADRVGAAAMQAVWGGAGAALTAALVMISTLGCANGLVLTGARVIYAMATDGLFPRQAARINQAQVPGFALIMQGAWAALLTLSGGYSELLDYVVFAQLVFYVLTVAAVFVLRAKRPTAPRPYRAWGYPWIPAAYIVSAAALMVDLLIVKPRYSWAGLLIALSGVPVYLMTRRSARARSEMRRAAGQG